MANNKSFYQRMANTDVNYMIRVTLAIIIVWSLLLPLFFGNANVNASSAVAPPNSEEDVSYLRQKALEAMEQSIYEQAIGYLDRILDIDPNYLQTLNNKGVALDDVGRYEDASGIYQQSVDYYLDEQALNQESTITTNTTRTSTNIEDHIISIKNIDDRDYYYYYANNIPLMLRQQQPYSNLELGIVPLNDLEGYNDGSKLRYITTFFSSQTDIEAEANKGIALFHQGNYQEALEIFDTILANDDSHLPSLYYKAQCLEKLGYLEEANQYMNKVRELDPNYQGGFLSQLDDTNTTAAEDNGGTAIFSDNASLNATTTVELAEEPFAVGHYRTVSDDMTSETEAQFSAEGNTTITLSNSTETITTRDTGEGTFSFLPGGGGGAPHGQIHMTTEDGSENATVDFTEFIKFDSSTGIGIAYFSTNSTGMLAPLNNMIAVFLDEIQPNEDSIVRFFEWKSDGGAPIGSSNNSTTTTN